MQAQVATQTYDGYIENGAFYPRQNLSSLPNRYVAVLTIIEVPVSAPGIRAKEERMALLDALENMVRTDTSPKLRMEDFPRLDFGREPIIFTNED